MASERNKAFSTVWNRANSISSPVAGRVMNIISVNCSDLLSTFTWKLLMNIDSLLNCWWFFIVPRIWLGFWREKSPRIVHALRYHNLLSWSSWSITFLCFASEFEHLQWVVLSILCISCITKSNELTIDIWILPVFPCTEIVVLFESGFIFNCKILPSQTRINESFDMRLFKNLNNLVWPCYRKPSNKKCRRRSRHLSTFFDWSINGEGHMRFRVFWSRHWVNQMLRWVWEEKTTSVSTVKIHPWLCISWMQHM